jgi:hypothetical protein
MQKAEMARALLLRLRVTGILRIEYGLTERPDLVRCVPSLQVPPRQRVQAAAWLRGSETEKLKPQGLGGAHRLDGQEHGFFVSRVPESLRRSERAQVQATEENGTVVRGGLLETAVIRSAGGRESFLRGEGHLPMLGAVPGSDLEARQNEQ